MSKPFVCPQTPVGTAPVGCVADLPPAEGWWIRAFRQWGGETAALSADMTGRFGAARAERILSRFGELMEILSLYARRPLAVQGAGSASLCSDEAVFALLCTTATHGAREDAMMIACLMVRPDVAPIAVSLAQGLGLEVERGLRARKLS